MRQQMRKIKVLGYPFAGGQPRGGVELTPAWLKSQQWFTNIQASKATPVVYEEVKVSASNNNSEHQDVRYNSDGDLLSKNVANVMESSKQLRLQTMQAFKDGYFPVVLGGDHSQAIGSVGAFKKMYNANAKILWIDAHFDVNTPLSSPSRNAHGMPLAYLSGYVKGFEHMNCMDMDKDICYFGVRSFEEGEEEIVQEKNVLCFESAECTVQRLEEINKQIKMYFKHTAKTNYWISFDIDGVDAGEFKSTGTDEGNGLSLDFTYALFEKHIPNARGMDFTEVNFELTEGETLRRDEETFRDIFEKIHSCVNLPVNEDEMRMPSHQDLENFNKM
jgi:arginase